jgi:hypothetical protein
MNGHASTSNTAWSPRCSASDAHAAGCLRGVVQAAERRGRWHVCRFWGECRYGVIEYLFQPRQASRAGTASETALRPPSASLSKVIGGYRDYLPACARAVTCQAPRCHRPVFLRRVPHECSMSQACLWHEAPTREFSIEPCRQLREKAGVPFRTTGSRTISTTTSPTFSRSGPVVSCRPLRMSGEDHRRHADRAFRGRLQPRAEVHDATAISVTAGYESLVMDTPIVAEPDNPALPRTSHPPHATRRRALAMPALEATSRHPEPVRPAHVEIC